MRPVVRDVAESRRATRRSAGRNHSSHGDPMQRSLLAVAIGLVALAACNDVGTPPLAPTESARMNVTSGAQYKSVSHAIRTAASPQGNLLVDFDESGVGNAAGTTREEVFAHVDALFACKNNGGNWPSDPKKQGVSADLAFGADFANKGGRTKGTLDVPVPESTLGCPGGQRRALVAIQWVSAPGLQFRLEDVTNGVIAELSDVSAVLDPTYPRSTALPQ